MKTHRNIAVIAAIVCVSLFVVVPVVTAAAKSPPSARLAHAYVNLVGPEDLTVSCNGHLGEIVHAIPYNLYCSSTGPVTTTTAPTTTVPSTTTTEAPTTTSPPTTTPVSNLTPAAALMAGSYFNRNVTGWAVDPQSSQFAADFVLDYQNNYGSVGVNTMPIYEVGPGTPDSSISPRSGCGNFLGSTGNKIPVPSYLNLNGSGDNPLGLYDPSTDQLWEFWQFGGSNGNFTACWGGQVPLGTTTGVFPQNYGLSATGISYVATTITENDVASGSINHAVAVILPSNCAHYIFPADRGDCNGSNQPHEGQWFRFAPGTSMPGGLTPFAQMVFKAISTYGMIVVDQGGAVMLEAEQDADWGAQGHSGPAPVGQSWNGRQEYQVVASLPWQDLQAIDEPFSLTAQPQPTGYPNPAWPGKNGPA